MKSYTDYGNTIEYSGSWIPKDVSNSDYAEFLRLSGSGEAILVNPLVQPKTEEQAKYEGKLFLINNGWDDDTIKMISNLNAADLLPISKSAAFVNNLVIVAQMWEDAENNPLGFNTSSYSLTSYTEFKSI